MIPKGGMKNIIKKAQELQSQMEKAQEELNSIEIEGQSGGEGRQPQQWRGGGREPRAAARLEAEAAVEPFREIEDSGQDHVGDEELWLYWQGDQDSWV